MLSGLLFASAMFESRGLLTSVASQLEQDRFIESNAPNTTLLMPARRQCKQDEFVDLFFETLYECVIGISYYYLLLWKFVIRLSSTMSRKRVILDVDTGVDDAHALLLALRSPLLDVLGVTCVSGNVDVDTVCAATLRVLDAAQASTSIRVARGFETPIIESVVHCPQIHGEDGLGDLDPPLPISSRSLTKSHAVEFIIEMLEQTEREGLPPVTIIALAPLTNIAAVLRLRPQLVAQRSILERIMWMGGSAFAGTPPRWRHCAWSVRCAPVISDGLGHIGS